MKRLAWLLIPPLVLSLTALPTTAAAPKPYVPVSAQETPLASGLTLTAFERLYPGGWVNGWLLTADLANPLITTDLVTAPGVTKGEPLSTQAARAGAIAAVNGDFFDIGQTGIALGSVVKGGEFLQSRIPEWPNAAGVGKDRIGRLLDITLEGTVTLPSGSYKLGAINLPTVPSNTIGLFTPLWTIPRTNAMYGATQAREVIVKAGKVVSISETVTSTPVPPDGFVLVGRDSMAPPLMGLKVGDPVTLAYGPKPDVQWAVGGMRYLVRQGQVADDLDDTGYKPRSALGFSANGRKMYLVTVDGRSEESGGLTLRELAEMMQGFGAWNVLELDGGGSSEMVARLPGQSGLTVINHPSDGRERAIPNGVGIFAAPGSGVAKSLAVSGDTKVFAGLTRRLTARAYDEQYGPAAVGQFSWRVEGVGAISSEGLFRSDVPGLANVIAEAPATGAPGSPVSGKLTLRVLGPVDRLELVGEGLRLAPGKSGSFTVRGYDAEGYTAPIDPADMTLTYDPSLFKAEATPGGVQVTALKEGAGLIKVAVQGKETWVPVVSAQASTVLNHFDTLANWSFQGYPATVTGSVTSAPGRQGQGIKLTYAFSGGATQAAYVQAAPSLVLPGRPEAVGLWVKGDGKGAWLRAILTDANGTNYTLNLARNVNWTDWRYVEAPVPAEAVYPVKLYRVYPVETDKSLKYSGELIFDDLTIRGAAALPPVPPAPAPATDSILQPAAKPSASSWTFALVGGLGLPDASAKAPLPVTLPGGLTGNGVSSVSLTADPTLSKAAQEAQVMLRQALAANPAFLVVDPALTSTAGEELLAQEAGQTPIQRMTAPARMFDRDGVRFILLGTGNGSLRNTQFSQLLTLKAMLDAAQGDANVRYVVVLGHHTPAQFTDRREGDLIARWLTEFEEQSGKSAAYLAPGGTARSVRRVDGIPFIEAGSPKAPLLFTIDPAPGAVWLRLTNP